jgi:dimethylhistidine N-methyltransferase
LYDERGSQLFDRICELDEYYPTRTELGILRDRIEEIGEVLGEHCLLIEYGSGSSLKTRVLLDHERDLAGYVPIDISREHLLQSSTTLQRRYPELQVLPVCADYTEDFDLPVPEGVVGRRVVFFPGSTIGNLEHADARSFLKHMAATCGRGGGVLIGVDLHKDTATLEAAYDDAEGISAAFALNLLERMNRELGSDFDLKRFGYYSAYDEVEQRVVMAIESLEDQVVRVGGQEIELEEGERIRTEHSYQFTLDGFRELAAAADLDVERVWTDDRNLFSVQFLTSS